MKAGASPAAALSRVIFFLAVCAKSGPLGAAGYIRIAGHLD